MQFYNFFFAFFYIYIQSVDCKVISLCEKCYCEEILIRSVPQMQVKCISMNITAIINENYSEVYELDYSHNTITQLTDDNLVKSENLVAFKVPYNEIREISNTYFGTTPNLVTLDLSHNKLEILDSDTFGVLTKLRVLNLKFNAFKKLPETLFLPLKSLIELDLSYNDVSGSFKAVKNILELYNGLNVNITHLKLNGIALNTLPRNYFDGLNNLKEICLSDNNLNEFPILPFGITTIDLSGNEFREITIKDLTYRTVKTLKLNRLKHLTNIHHYAFYDLLYLEELSLEHCPKLQEFSDLAFEYIENGITLPLKKLSFAGSGLRRLNKTYFHLFSTLDSINLDDNPWICDCDLSWFQLIRKDKLGRYENVRCTSPFGPINKLIMEMDFEPCTIKGSNRLQRIIIPILVVLIILMFILIIYLCYLNPLKHVGLPVGPNSPYQRVVQQL